MTGREAFEATIDAIKDFHKRHPNGKPTYVEMHWDFAYDLAKLGRAELGDLSEKIWIDGIQALEKHGLFGLKVVIDMQTEGSAIKVS